MYLYLTFLFISYQANLLMLTLVEVKICVVHHSENNAMNALKDYVGVSFPTDANKKLLIQVDLTDAMILHQLLADSSIKDHHKRECIQLLHHVYVYGATSELLVIGNNVKFLYAIEVTFLPELLLAYKNVVEYISKYFDFFCLSLDEFPEEKIQDALEI